MKTLDISVHLFSQAVWSLLFEHTAFRRVQRQSQFFELMAGLDSLREKADYNTGSVSMASSWALYSVANYFCPRQMAEVGTFIGRSTLSLACGVDDANELAEIHTCDISNDISLPQCTRSTIVQYPKKSSTEMLTLMKGASPDWSLDLVHLDGRLQGQDITLLGGLCSEDVVIVLDDFEGIEKGVANYRAIRESGWLKSHLLVYPPHQQFLREHGLADRSVTALLVPSRLVRFTAQ